MAARIIFLVNLLQDVGIVRPLAHLAARDFSAPIDFLVSRSFVKRDRDGSWLAELNDMCRQLGAGLQTYDTPQAAHTFLQGKSGVLIAASESNLKAHWETHMVFRIAPSGFLKITLQHGYECVGFLHNREQSLVHGARVGFAADVICGWSDASMLRSISPSERPKLYVTGPTLAMTAPDRRPLDAPAPGNGGLVCENLHSVRFSTASERRTSFMEQFVAFSAVMGWRKKRVVLRPHPGGQYVLKNAVPLPANVGLENRPLYRIKPAAFDFAISAPSTILIDMMLAGVPVAMWNDPAAGIDSSNYQGLHTILTVDDWLNFERDAVTDPAAFRREQADFLASTKMLLDPGEVQMRFARLLAGAPSPIVMRSLAKPFRILFFVNAIIPSFTISFLHPLHELHTAGKVDIVIVTENDLAQGFLSPGGNEAAAWIEQEIVDHQPDLIVACRYSGPHAERIVRTAQATAIPVLYHLDDDLLSIPPEIGERKYKLHNAPERLASITTFLTNADLIYASTPALRDRVTELGFDRPIVSGAIYCADEVRRPADRRLYRTFGYMGGRDHGHDLATIVPAIVAVMDRNPDLRFEIFGGIPMPGELVRFGDRVGTIEPVEGYDAFRQRFAQVEWDVGLCPLFPSTFNRCKADTKWVDYSAVGIAVIAAAGMGYDKVCADGCGVLADSPEEWIAAIESLCSDATARFEQVTRAQARLVRDYTPRKLSEQLVHIFGLLGVGIGDASSNPVAPDSQTLTQLA